MTALHQATPCGEFRLGLLAEPTAPAIMRRLTKWALESWALPHLVDDAVVIINELATNAVAVAPGLWIEMRLRLRSQGVLLECWDPSPELPPAPQMAEEDAEGGRGLLVVACLATRHGVESTPERQGKIVWALLDPQAAEAAA